MGRGGKARHYQRSRPELQVEYEKRRDHTIERVKERYGLDMSVGEYEELHKQMPNNKTEERYLTRRAPDEREKGNIRFYAAYWRKSSTWLAVAYSFRSYQIVTALPPKCLPDDLPSPAEMEVSLCKGSVMHHLKRHLSEVSGERPPVSIDGNIAWGLVDMEAPATVPEAHAYLIHLGTQLQEIENALPLRTQENSGMSQVEFDDWRERAKFARAYHIAQMGTLKAYIRLEALRSKRLKRLDSTEGVLFDLIRYMTQLHVEGRIEYSEEDWRVIDGARQHLENMGWNEARAEFKRSKP